MVCWRAIRPGDRAAAAYAVGHLFYPKLNLQASRPVPALSPFSERLTDEEKKSATPDSGVPTVSFYPILASIVFQPSGATFLTCLTSNGFIVPCERLGLLWLHLEPFRRHSCQGRQAGSLGQLVGKADRSRVGDCNRQTRQHQAKTKPKPSVVWANYSAKDWVYMREHRSGAGKRIL